MKDLILLGAVILLLFFGGATLATFVTWKLADKYSVSKRWLWLITFFIGLLLIMLAIVIAGINGYTNF